MKWALSLLSAADDVTGQDDEWARFAVIEYDNTRAQFVYSGRQWNHTASSYICQLPQGLFNDENNASYSVWLKKNDHS